MKKIKFLIVIIIVLVICFFIFYTPISRLYNSSLINSESFKTSDLEKKKKLIEDKEFRSNCSEEDLTKIVELFAQDVIKSNDVLEKINLLNYPEFVLYGSLETRKQLVESIFDTPNISDEDFISFLKSCRSVDYEVISKKFEEKKPVYSFKIIKVLKDISSHLHNFNDKTI